MSIARGSILLAFSMVVGLALAGPTPGDDDKKMKPQKCAGEEFKIPTPDDGMKKDMEACQKDPECHALCVAKVLGVVDDKGMIIESEVMDRVSAIAPASKAPEITKVVSSCIEKHGKMLDAQKCGTYKDLIQCGITGIKPICDWKD